MQSRWIVVTRSAAATVLLACSDFANAIDDLLVQASGDYIVDAPAAGSRSVRLVFRPGATYEIETRSESGDARLMLDEAEGLPVIVTVHCGATMTAVLAVASGEPVLPSTISKQASPSVVLRVNRIEMTCEACPTDEPRDACLIGDWQMAHESLPTRFSAHTSFCGGQGRSDVAGRLQVRFARDGRFTAVHAVTATKRKAITTFNGTTYSCWHTQRVAASPPMTVLNIDKSTGSVNVTTDENCGDAPPRSQSTARLANLIELEIPKRYTCAGDTLTLLAGGTVYRRLSGDGSAPMASPPVARRVAVGRHAITESANAYRSLVQPFDAAGKLEAEMWAQRRAKAAARTWVERRIQAVERTLRERHGPTAIIVVTSNESPRPIDITWEIDDTVESDQQLDSTIPVVVERVTAVARVDLDLRYSVDLPP